MRNGQPATFYMLQVSGVPYRDFQHVRANTRLNVAMAYSFMHMGARAQRKNQTGPYLLAPEHATTAST